jgi:serine/threonine-protein kinase
VSCPSCGAPLAPDARFCPACGKQAVPTATAATPVPPSEPSLVGREIAGRYRILKKLGEGGMGAVFRGEQISLKRAVAVKLLRPELSQNAHLLGRFKIEAEAVAKLKHPNTVDIYDFGQDSDGTLFIAMEFIEGRSLRGVIHAEAPLPPARALYIASQIAASLADAHSHSIVHRDLKPDNVMLMDRGRQRDIARVLDFGIAKLRDDQRGTQAAMTQAGDMLGTPQYMAPEQIKGEQIDGRTDVYALGCMIYEMVTARLPFEAATVMAMLSKHLMEEVVPPSRRRPDLGLPPVIDQLVLTAMMKQSVARPPTMELYGEQIAAALAMLPPDPNRSASTPLSAVQPVPTPQPTPPPVVTPGARAFAAAPSQFPPSQLPTLMHTRGAKKSRAPLYAALAVVVLGGGGVAAYFATRTEPKSAEPDPTPAPSPRPAPPDAAVHKDDPWAGGTAPAPAPKPLPSGEVVQIGGNVKLVLPHGFQHELENGVVVAGDGTYLVLAGPMNTTLTDPTAVAKEYARVNHLAFDKLGTLQLAGGMRYAATFHGNLKGLAIEEQVVAYSGVGYSVGVGVAVPYRKRNDAAVQRFAHDLFDKRVVLP